MRFVFKRLTQNDCRFLLQMQYVLQGAGERDDESDYGDDDDDDVDSLRMLESDAASTEFDIDDVSWSSVVVKLYSSDEGETLLSIDLLINFLKARTWLYIPATYTYLHPKGLLFGHKGFNEVRYCHTMSPTDPYRQLIRLLTT